MSTQVVWLAARLVGAAAGFVFQLCLARIMSPRDLGLFFSCSSIATILGIVATQGYPNIAARFVARYSERGRDAWLAQFLACSQRATLTCAVLIALVVVAAAALWPMGGVDRLAFAYEGFSIPAMAALIALAALGIAQRSFFAALLPDLLLRPVTLALIAGALFAFGKHLDASQAMLAFFVVTLAVAVVQLGWIRPTPAPPVRRSRLTRHWQREAWTLLAVMLFTSFFGDLAVVSATPFLAAADVAAFGLALKISMIVGFGVQIAHQVVLPDLSAAYARREPEALTPILLKGALFPIAFSGAAVIVTAAFGQTILGMYGPQFKQAAGPLLLLVLCQFVRAVAGPSQNVLTLEGRQTTNLVICVTAGIVLFVGDLTLAKPFGLWGAALAATLAYMVWIVAGAVTLAFCGQARTDVFSLTLRHAARGAGQAAT